MEVRGRGGLAYALAIQAILLSAALHTPFGQHTLYTDVVGFYWRDFAEAGRIPYLDLDAHGEPFEYPALAAAITALCGLAGSLEGFYAAYCLTVACFAILMTYCAIRLSRSPLLALCLTAPSLIAYGIYGYDVIMAALTALAILLHARGRYVASAIALAASVHVKLYSILFLPYALVAAPRDERARFLAAFALAALAPVMALPGAYAQLVSFHAAWGLENAWYVIFFPEAATRVGRALEWAPSHVAASIKAAQLFGYAIIATLYLAILSHAARAKMPPEKFMALALMAFLIGAPRYSPQTNILLLPLLPSVLSPGMVPAFIAWELANSAIIPLWFTTRTPEKPWAPPQLAVLLRFIALSLLLAQAGSSLGVFKLKMPKKLAFLISRLGARREWARERG